MIIAIIIAAIARLSFQFSLQPAHAITTLNQIVLSCMLGSGFSLAHLKKPLRFYLDLLILLFINLLFIALCAYLMHLLFSVTFEVAYLAYMPGGIEAMILIAISIASNPILISAMHISRVVYLAFLLPLMIRYYVKPKIET